MIIRTMKYLALAVWLVAASAYAEEAKAPQADTEATVAARELLEVTGAAKQVDNMIAALTKSFAVGAEKQGSEAGKQASAEFEVLMKRFAGYKAEMLNDIVKLYVETFTAAEMKEVANFYRSGTGAKFIATTPVLMQKGGEIGRKYAERIVQEMSAEKKK